MRWFRKILFALAALVLIGTGVATAQQSENQVENGGQDPLPVEDINNPGIDHNEALKKFGLKHLFNLESGLLFDDITSDGNEAIIEQVGTENSAQLTQKGSGLYGHIKQDGSFNEAIVEQEGTQLISLVNMEGVNNYLKFEQSGYRKGALFDFQGSNIQFDASQSNSGFTLSPRNSSMPALEISSSRSMLPIIIRNN